MCNAWNHAQGCPCGFGGDTGAGGGGPSLGASTVVAWHVTDRGARVTHRTRCWWCGADVYFLRDENGGCALFDRLGAPWEVHGCWEEHRHERESSLKAVASELEQAGFDGYFYRPSGRVQQRPLTSGGYLETAGYVASDCRRYFDGRASCSFRHGGCDGFFRVLICDSSDHLWPALVRSSVARRLGNFQPVRLRGKWVRYAGDWLLFATELVDDSPGRGERILDRFMFGQPSECGGCGRRLLIREQWDFDQRWRVRCTTCQHPVPPPKLPKARLIKRSRRRRGA
jgi:hypothetical protein